MKFPGSVRVEPKKTVSAAVAGARRAHWAELFLGLPDAAVLVVRLRSFPVQAGFAAYACFASSEAYRRTLTDAQMAKMSSDELAHYVFENHGCNGCHTLGANGKLGFTDRGKEVGKGFEDASTQLTAMSNIVKVKESDRSEDQKRAQTRFQEFGCTTCHQLTRKAQDSHLWHQAQVSPHLACTDVSDASRAQKR